MTSEVMTRDLALRIGLAAKALPDVDTRSLLNVLISKLGQPLTDAKLRQITVTDIRTALGSMDGEDDSEDTGIDKNAMKTAVRYLWGEDIEDPELPPVVAYAEGDMPCSIRVAIASTQEEKVDGHYGSCPRFLVYQVSASQKRLIDIRPTDGADEAEDKNAFRAEIIADCDVLYVQSVGGPAAAKIIRAGIYPIKLSEGGEVQAALSRLQTT